MGSEMCIRDRMLERQRSDGVLDSPTELLKWLPGDPVAEFEQGFI